MPLHTRVAGTNRVERFPLGSEPSAHSRYTTSPQVVFSCDAGSKPEAMRASPIAAAPASLGIQVGRKISSYQRRQSAEVAPGSGAALDAFHDGPATLDFHLAISVALTRDDNGQIGVVAVRPKPDPSRCSGRLIPRCKFICGSVLILPGTHVAFACQGEPGAYAPRDWKFE